jgi:proline iminopeptidase
MNIQRRKIALSVLLSAITVFIFLVFVPRKYNVPRLQKRAATRFWNLPTGSRIGYIYIQGKGVRKASPIIFLNGGPGGYITDEGIKLRSTLADFGYDIYMYDQIGSGQSDRLKNISEYTADRHKKDLEEIIRKIGTPEVILIGQSWGAVLAVLYAAENNNKIDKIIFTCPAPIYPVRQELIAAIPPDSLNLKAPLFNNSQGNIKANNIRTKAMVFFATHFGVKLATDKEADDFESYLDFEVNKSTVYDTANIQKISAGGGYYASVMTFNSLLTIQDPRPKLKNSAIPVLVMKAQYDNQQWGFTNEYSTLFPKHKLIVVPNVGHAIAVENPTLYLEAIASFLSQQ